MIPCGNLLTLKLGLYLSTDFLDCSQHVNVLKSRLFSSSIPFANSKLFEMTMAPNKYLHSKPMIRLISYLYTSIES